MSRTTDALALIAGGMTQYRAAKVIGVSQSTLSRAQARARARAVRPERNTLGCQVTMRRSVECNAVPAVFFGARRYCALHRAPLEAALRGAV